MIDNEVVKDLVKKLKLFRETILSINKSGFIKYKHIPASIREEAAKIYMEHSGIDILMDVLHVSADQVRKWTRKLKIDPNYYTKKKESSIVKGVTQEKRFPKKRKRPQIVNTRKNIFSALSSDLQERCEALKKNIEEYRVKNNGSISIELKRKVVDVVNEAGTHKPIAILLGLSERLIDGWRYYYTDKPDFTDNFD